MINGGNERKKDADTRSHTYTESRVYIHGVHTDTRTQAKEISGISILTYSTLSQMHRHVELRLHVGEFSGHARP